MINTASFSDQSLDKKDLEFSTQEFEVAQIDSQVLSMIAVLPDFEVSKNTKKKVVDGSDEAQTQYCRDLLNLEIEMKEDPCEKKDQLLFCTIAVLVYMDQEYGRILREMKSELDQEARKT